MRKFFSKIKSLWRVTAVRLSIAYTVAFAILAVLVVIYMTGGAVNYLRKQTQDAINGEIASLNEIYRTSGINGLVFEMEARASRPGAKLYVIADQTGRIIAGNIRDLESRILEKEGWALRPFAYEGFDDQLQNRDNDDGRSRAVARVFKLPNGLRVLIGQDIGQPERLRGVVNRALSLAMVTMLLASFLIWFFVGRRALNRIDMVSRSTERILAGDRSERLPITGSRDEFDRLSTRMNAMLDRIALLDDGLKNVSDSIAHDLKTPLTRLRNKVDSALISDIDLKRSKEVLGEVISDSDQLIKTFNALLMISRVESGSQIGELEPINVTQIMEDICELYEPVAEDEGAKIECELAPDVQISGNRELLFQALTNLVDNALKYGTPTDKRHKKTIKLSLSKTKNQVEAVVADNGAGVAKEDRQVIKERFKRLDESRSLPGNGLGLSLVDAIVKMHDGQMQFEDAKPGLKVQLRFPKLKS